MADILVGLREYREGRIHVDGALRANGARSSCAAGVGRASIIRAQRLSLLVGLGGFLGCSRSLRCWPTWEGSRRYGSGPSMISNQIMIASPVEASPRYSYV